MEEEIEQADVFKEHVQQSIISTEQLITIKTTNTTISTEDRTSLCTNVTRETTSDDAETTTSSTTIHRTSAIIDASSVKLPKLVPKKFNGDLTNWESFSVHLSHPFISIQPYLLFTNLTICAPC